MEYLKIIMVGEDDLFFKTIKEYFKDIFFCKDWSSFLDVSIYYDLLVVSFEELRQSGFCMLEQVAAYNINKNVIVLVNKKLNLFLKNHICPINYITNDISIIEFKNKIETIFFNENQIEKTLISLGIPKHLKGRLYLQTAFNILIYKRYLTKDLYLMLANQYNTQPSSVERSIRHAIEISWNRADHSLTDNLFGRTLNINRERPSNKEYIETVISFLKRTVH
jgi:hypothetical protein